MVSLRCAVLLAIAMASTVLAQSIPTLNNVSLLGSVTLSGDVYTYSYSARNSSTSTGSVWTIGLDITQPIGGEPLNSTGLANGDGFLEDTAKAVADRPEAVPTIPIAGKAPVGWICSVPIDGRVVWGAESQNALIPPGGATGGYELTSRGLPGIRAITAEPFIDLAQLAILPPSGPSDLKRYDVQSADLQASVRFAAMTVGPTAPPATFGSKDFLRTIIHYKEQALSRGWIKDQGIGISLDAKLNAASASLARGDAKTAVNELNALLHEVDAQAGKQLSSEAVALLKFNTQYLISKIQ